MCGVRDVSPSVLGTGLLSLLPVALIMSLMPACLEWAKVRAEMRGDG